AFVVFGKPGSEIWGWRVEGHHLSLHFSSVDGKVAFMPGFMGSNPAKVPPGMPGEGRQILKPELEAAFSLLNSFTQEQAGKAILRAKAPHDIFTANARKAMMEKKEGIPMS